MAVTINRSPRYPAISLKDAIEKAAAVYKADRRNKIPKQLVAEHMGYGGLNGASLGVISAVNKYGLLDGGRDSMWITPRTVDILEREVGDPERAAALRAAAFEPALFRELAESFEGHVSDAALRSYLIAKRDFLPDSAVKLIRAYRDTMAFVDAESGAYDSAPIEPDVPPVAARELAPEAPVSPPIAGPAIAGGVGEREWLRGPLSRTTSYRLIVSGNVGARELGKLVKLLEAQRAVLEDEDDELA